MTTTTTAAAHYPVGSYRGVTIEVAAWDAVSAQVDLAVACLFEHEVPGSELSGGLYHLDRALDGRLTQLRAAGGFRADVLDVLLLQAPPAPILAKAVLVIGLGDPLTRPAGLMTRAVLRAVSEAIRLAANAAAFAPSLLDAGLEPEAIMGIGPQMIAGLVDGLDAAHQLAELRLAPPPQLKRWSFAANAGHAATVAAGFRAALEAQRPPA